MPFEELAPLLEQNPALRTTLERAFVFPKSAAASRVSYGDNRELAGELVGPYTFWAKQIVREGQPALLFEITLETKVTWLNHRGKPTNLKHAMSVKQIWTGYRVAPAKPEDKK